jgi:uncharacterized membrane protein
MPDPAAQAEIDEAEWQNSANWHGGILGVYYSRRDSRSLVPKRSAWMGMTINFARPLGVWLLIAILTLSLLPVVLTAGARR